MAPLPHSMDMLMSLSRRGDDSPLQGLENWNPIKIDALGLVTLLGAEEVDKSVGTLQRRRYTECLPLLAAFVISGNRFTEEKPGYALYNLTDGVHTTELKGWFTRWLSSQRIRNSTTIFRWSVEPTPRQDRRIDMVAPVIALLGLAPLFACTILIGDWFGLGNSLALILSILVRKFLLWQRRTALNAVVAPEDEQALPMHSPSSEKAHRSVDTFTKQLHREGSQPNMTEILKLLVTRADGKLVTIYCPRSILSAFVRDAPLQSSSLYHAARWIGWMAFGAHVIVLGMSSLFTQIYTVVMLVISTWAYCHGFAMDAGQRFSKRPKADGTTSEVITSAFTSRLAVEQENPATKSTQGADVDKRMYAYVRAEVSEKQEAMLKHWSMLPFEGVPWYETYEQVKQSYNRSSGPARSGIAVSSPTVSTVSSTDTAQTVASQV